MDNTSLVREDDQTARGTTSLATAETGPSDTTFRPVGTPSTRNQITADGLSVVRQELQAKGFSTQAQELMLASWRPGTKKQYDVYIKKWINYSSRRGINPTEPAVKDIIEFLTGLFHSGVGYSGINTARSALATFVMLPGAVALGKHPDISRLVKGVFQLKPSVPRYQGTWDVSIVLDYLETLYPHDSISLKELTLKLVMLTALVTGQRGQSLHLMDLTDMVEGQEGYTFEITAKVKQSRPGKDQPVLILNWFTQNLKLCVASVLREYIKRTKDLRHSARLFIAHIEPHNAVSRDTISRWTRTVMQAAGIDVKKFAPHSTRAASVSKAHKARLPMDTILRTAGWSRDSTFNKFYNKPVEYQGQSFAQAILD